MHLAPSSARRSDVSSSEESRGHVLLAEDDDELRGLFAKTLRDAGFEVHTAADGQEVLCVLSDAAREDAPMPDAIVMDVRMPRKSGLDVLRAIRTTGWSQPVVLVTGYGDPVLHAMAAELGAAVILDKPVDREDLVAVVELLIQSPQLDS
jgi:DNA-binding response OmpR family regulator